ncbi:MAG: cadherin-like domain-containing protein, partial [Nitrospira sp.]
RITSNGGGATALINIAENATAVTRVTASDADTRQTLAYSIVGGADAAKFTINSSTGALSFVSAPNYEAPTDSGGNNVYDVTVQVSDGSGGVDSQAISVTVTAVNERPTDLSLSANTVAEHAANGTVVGTVTGSDPDAGDTKSYSLTNTAGGRFAINRTTGALTVANSTLLNYEAATSHAVTVRVTDRGGLTYDETFTINLTNVNEAPTGTNATVTITEDTSHVLTAANFGFSDVDAGDALSAVRIDTLPTAGTLTLSGTAVTAGQVITTADLAASQLVFTPAANANGTGYARVAFSVRDSTSLYDPTPNTLTVNVTAVNDRPVITANSGSSVAEGGTDTITSAELAAVDVDNSAAQLRFSVGTGPAHGRLELTTRPGVALATFTQADLAANRLVYRHDGSETLSDRFTFTVSDGAGGSVGTTTMTLTITPVNDAPTIINNEGAATASINVAEHVTGITVVTGADVDLPVQALTYSISGGADQAQFTIDASTGALSFVAPPDFEAAADANGDNVYIVQVRVTDSQGGTAMQTIQVRVTDGAEVRPSGPALPPSLIPMPSAQAGTSVQAHDEPLSFTTRQESVNAVSMNGTDLAGTMSRYTGSMPPRVAPHSGDVHHEEEPPVASRPVQSDDREPRNSSPISSTDAIEAGRDGDSGPQPSANELVLNKLDEVILSLREAVAVDREPQSLMAQVTALAGTTLSVGFVLWAVRKGRLLAGCCATIPTLSAEGPGRGQHLRPQLLTPTSSPSHGPVNIP